MTELATSSRSGMFDRMMRAARLEVPLYEEVEADLTATNQALLVVVIVSVARGIGQGLSASLGTAPAGGLVGTLIGGILSALIGWAVWSYVVYFVGTRFMGGTATYGELLRTLGFAQTPGILLIFSFIPVLGGIIGLVAAIWSLIAGFIATRQALDIDNTKTVITIVIGVIALAIVVTIVAIIIGAIFGAGFAVGRLL
jgi:hypothetical protein